MPEIQTEHNLIEHKGNNCNYGHSQMRKLHLYDRNNKNIVFGSAGKKGANLIDQNQQNGRKKAQQKIVLFTYRLCVEQLTRSESDDRAMRSIRTKTPKTESHNGPLCRVLYFQFSGFSLCGNLRLGVCVVAGPGRSSELAFFWLGPYSVGLVCAHRLSVSLRVCVCVCVISFFTSRALLAFRASATNG